MSSRPTNPDSEGKTEPPHHSEGHDIDLLLADSWNRPLWRRLLANLYDIVSPEKLPPLELTSRPANVGMLEGDVLSLPWYRTVFTNLGDVISPETLPPLELESQPADVGELISDQMSHGWWSSLLRNLADKVAPERLPALQVTSKPMDPGSESALMALPRWSAVISTPKVFLPDKPRAEFVLPPMRVTSPKPKADAAEVEYMRVLAIDLKRDLLRSRFRQRIWVSLAFLELATWIATAIWWK